MKKNQENTNEKNAAPANIATMQKEFTRRLISLCLVTLIGAVTVFTYLSRAWFSNNEKTHNGTSIVASEVPEDLMVDGYTVYKRENVQQADGSMTKKYTATTSDSLNDVDMLPFDSVFGRNENTPLIVRILVSGKAVDGHTALLLTLDREDTEELKPYCDDGFGLHANATNETLHTENGKIINYLSNIAQIKFAVIKELNDATQAEKIYDTALTYFKNQVPAAKAYAEQTRNGKDYTVTKNTNSLLWNLPSDYGADCLTDDGHLYIYVEIDYEEHLVAAYLQNHESNFGIGKLGQTQMLEFIGDLDTLTVSK